MRKHKDKTLIKKLVELHFTTEELSDIIIACERNYLDMNQYCRIAAKHMLACPAVLESKTLDLTKPEEIQESSSINL